MWMMILYIAPNLFSINLGGIRKKKQDSIYFFHFFLEKIIFFLKK